MSILCDHEIRDAGMVEGCDPALINPASLDLRLGSTIMIESAEDLNMRPLSIADRTADDPYWLRPGQFILAETIERFNMPEDVAGLFFLKSSRAREGYEHSHAGYGDPGWHGSVLTLELKNVRQILPLPLYPGLKIGQMAFIRMSAKPSTSYATVGHYNGHKTVMGSVACHLPPLLVGCASGLPPSSPFMTDKQHPITPPPELVQELANSIRIPTRSCYPGDPVTDHEELMLTLGHLFARIEHLEKANNELRIQVKAIQSDLQ